MLRNLQADIEGIRYDPGDGAIEIPVTLKVHDSVFVPLAKWPMLLAGNYRCIRRDEMIPIKEAVHGNVDASRDVYRWASDLCTGLGAADADLVPFEKYAKAAEGLAKPSSARVSSGVRISSWLFASSRRELNCSRILACTCSS